MIGETGDMNSTLLQAYDKIRIYQIPNGLIRNGETNILVIEVKKYFQKEIGIEQDKTAIGDSLLIQKELLETGYIKILLLMVYATASIYFFFFICVVEPTVKIYTTAYL